MTSMAVDNQTPNLDNQSSINDNELLIDNNQLPILDPQSNHRNDSQENLSPNWADDVNLNANENAGPSSFPNSSNDIRTSNPIDEQEKIILWCNTLEFIERTASDID